MALSITMLSLGIQALSKPIFPIWISVIMLLSGICLLMRFIQLENKKNEPLIRYKLLQHNPVYTMSVIISAIQDIVMFGAIFVLSLLFQEVFQLSPSLIGAIFIPIAIFTSLFMWIEGHWFDSGKSLNFIQVGMILVALSIISFSFLPKEICLSMLILLMVGRGIGAGLSNMTITTIGLHALSEDELHEGSVLANTNDRFASSLAVMLLAVYYDFRWGFMVESGEPLAYAKWMALKEECIILGCLMLITLPLVSIIKRRRADDGAKQRRGFVKT